MNNLEIMLSESKTTNFWEYAKYPYLIFFVIYLIFSLIVIRQIKLMITTINGKLSPAIKILGWVNLGISVVVFLFSIIIL